MIEKNRRSALEEWLGAMNNIARKRGFGAVQWGSSEGLPLLGLLRSSDRADPRAYLSAGIHGDEPAGPLAIEKLLADDLLDRGVSWTICPLLNPGGWLTGTRETPGGVDLNRDYREPRSPEAAAHRAWIDSLKPHDFYLSLHEDWEATGFYLYEINTSTYRPFASRILTRVAEVIPIEPLECIDQHMVCAPGHIAHPPEPDEPHNWPEAIYHCKRYPHLSYTFETPSSFEIGRRVAAQVAAVVSGTEAFLSAWRERA